MEPQEAVNQPVEPTTPMASAPVETQAPETQSTPAESNQPEKKVSDAVPYDRFAEVNARAKQLEAEVAALRATQSPRQDVAPQPSQSPAPQLDPESEMAVRSVIARELAQARVAEFYQRHQGELQDPVLRGTHQAIVESITASGQVPDLEATFTQARNLIEERAKPQVKQAETQAFQEGQEIARAKEKMGPVGDTTKTAPPVDPDTMNAAEFAAYMNIPRSTGL